MGERRIKLTVAYDGTSFYGWQKQHPPDEAPLRTAQGVLEAAVRDVIREPVSVHGASRTDSGVHAIGQVASFDTTATMDVQRMPAAISSRLPDDIRVLEAQVVPREFNVIGDVESKGYRYRVAWGRREAQERPLFERYWVSWVPYVLDIDLMNAAAQDLIGRHDFAAFTRLNHGRESTERLVSNCSVHVESDRTLWIDVEGEGFLWNMVRIIAGTLVDIGASRRAADSIPSIIESGDRAAAGPTMPPEGLCLQWIRYGTPGTGRQRQLAASRLRLES